MRVEGGLGIWNVNKLQGIQEKAKGRRYSGNLDCNANVTLGIGLPLPGPSFLLLSGQGVVLNNLKALFQS